MINKSKKCDIKFVESLAIDVVKQLLDRFDSEDGWLNVMKVLPNNELQKKKSHFCHFCNKGFATEKNVKVHIDKFHTVTVDFRCDVCDFKTENEKDLKRHDNEKHRLPVIKEEIEKDGSNIEESNIDVNKVEVEMEIDTEAVDEVDDIKNGVKRNREKSDSSSPISSPPSKKVQEEFIRVESFHISPVTLEEECLISEVVSDGESNKELTDKVRKLEGTIQKLNSEQEKVTDEKQKQMEDLNNAMTLLKKENGVMKKELKQIKEENAKLNLEIGQIQYDKDKLDAKSKAEEKLKRIKNNTKLFNEIIQKQLDDGEIRNIDLSMHQTNDMEECDGGEASSSATGYGFGDLKNMVKNKKLGGKRSSPQDNPEIRKVSQKVREMKKCPQCDFIPQNDVLLIMM